MLAERAAQAGAFVGLAHPEWYGATVEDLQSIPSAHAVEVYNEVCAQLTDRAESWYHADALLSAGRRISGFGADDAHFRAEMPELTEDIDDLNQGGVSFLKRLQETAVDPIATESGEDTPAGFSAWVWVSAERLDPDLLVESLKAGRYYTSQGPRIHDIKIDETSHQISVVTSPATSVFVSGNPAIIGGQMRHGSHLTHTTFSYRPFRDSYCRVTVIDSLGKRAWSNPIWFD
jgi:hypothetical protein